MIKFNTEIEWCDTVAVKNTIIDSINIPRDLDKQTIINFYNNILDKIKVDLNTPEKCIHFMEKYNMGPFRNNYIDRSYHIISINITTNLEDDTMLKRENKNFIYKFSKYFEILRDDNNNYTWRFTEF